MRCKIWQSFASGVEIKNWAGLLVLAGAYLGESLDGVDCYIDGTLKDNRLCIGLGLSVQSLEIRAGSINLLREARGEKMFRQQSRLFLVVFSLLGNFPFIVWIHSSLSTMLSCKSNSSGSSVQWQQRLLLGHSHQWNRLVIADSKPSTGLFS